jgi:hypothetical protein
MEQSNDVFKPVSSMIKKDGIPIFEITFVDGYTFRQLFEFIKIGSFEAPILIYEDRLVIESSNGDETLYFQYTIKSKNLIEYNTKIQYFNDKSRNRHIVLFDLSEFQLQIKSISKKEGLKIFQYADCEDFFFLQPVGGNKSNSSGLTIKTKKGEIKSYELQNISSSSLCKIISLSSFCHSTINISRSKYTSAIFNIYSDGFSIISGNSIKSTSQENSWGICNGKPLYVINIKKDIIKALSKTSNFDPSGIIRVYGLSNNLLCFAIPLSCYGKVIIYIKNEI